MNRFLTLLAVPMFAVAMSAAAADVAPDKKPVEKASVEADVMTPVQIMAKIHHINEMEIQAGELARAKAKTSAVKNYGDMLVRDHTDADKKVLALARKQGLTIPTQASSSKDHAAMTKLTKLSGTAFEKEFLPAMKDGHDEAISFMTSAKKKTADAPLAALIGELLPVVKQHDQLAMKLQR